MKRYAVLLAPDFRLQSLLRHASHLAGEPVALLDAQGRKAHIAEMNSLARASQVEVGMTPTQAMARCAKLQTLSANPGQERAAQDALLQTAENLSPFLESTAPGLITVGLPDERSFTESELMQKCTTPLLSVGLAIRIGVAATPDLGLLCARFAEPISLIESPSVFLAPLPVETLEPSAELLTVLRSWGIRTIGELIALPMNEACERLGPEMLGLRERANGGKPRPLKLVKSQEFYAEQTELEHPVEMLESLLFLLRRFLEQITLRLGNANLVAAKLRLVLKFEYNAPYQRIFTLPQPTRDVELLFRMLHTHLEGFTSESPIIALGLAAKPARPNAEQFGLWENTVRDPYHLSDTLARLEALLGSDRVGTPEIEPSAHPDAMHLRPYDANAPALPPTDAPLIGIPLMRFRPSIPANILLNDHQPEFMYSDHFTGPIKQTYGP